MSTSQQYLGLQILTLQRPALKCLVEARVRPAQLSSRPHRTCCQKQSCRCRSGGHAPVLLEVHWVSDAVELDPFQAREIHGQHLRLSAGHANSQASHLLLGMEEVQEVPANSLGAMAAAHLHPALAAVGLLLVAGLGHLLLVLVALAVDHVQHQRTELQVEVTANLHREMQLLLGRGTVAHAHHRMSGVPSTRPTRTPSQSPPLNLKAAFSHSQA